jgi:MinD-like ATPase involved in chromosome partitioning or flagellar assembly
MVGTDARPEETRDEHDTRSLFAVLTGARDPASTRLDATALDPGYAPTRRVPPTALASRPAEPAVPPVAPAVPPAPSARPHGSLPAGPRGPIPPGPEPHSTAPGQPQASGQPEFAPGRPPQPGPHPEQFPAVGPRPSPTARPPKVTRSRPSPLPGRPQPRPRTPDRLVAPLAHRAAPAQPADVVSRVRTPVVGGHHRIVVVGVGPKAGATLVSYCLADVFAALRDDKVVALELNAHGRGLAHRARPKTRNAVQDLARYGAVIQDEADVRRFTSATPHGLDVIHARPEPPALRAGDYQTVVAVLERYYSVSVVDAGSGRDPDVHLRAIQLADQLVITGPSSSDAVHSMPTFLDWLAAVGRPDLVGSAIALLSPAAPQEGQQARAFLRRRFGTVEQIPYDPHLAEDSEIVSSRLGDAAEAAFIRVAAILADRFRSPHSRGGAS